MTLTEFLLARIAEDEAAAKAATPGPWTFEWDDHSHVIIAAEPHPASVRVTETGYDLSSRWVAETSYDDQSSTTYNSVADGHHIARHNPARVLRECEAKRRIVDDVQCGWFDTDLAGACKHLAAVYSDHPDYDEEWKP